MVVLCKEWCYKEWCGIWSGVIRSGYKEWCCEVRSSIVG